MKMVIGDNGDNIVGLGQKMLGIGMKVNKNIVVAALCLGLLSACGSAVKQTFDLNPLYKIGASGKSKKRYVQISVPVPGALKTLDGQDMVIRGGDGSVAYLESAQWSDRLTNLVQMRLVQALEDTGHFGGVGRPGDGLNVNYQLITDLRIFGVDLSPAGRFAHIEIAVKLMDDKNGIMRKMRVFSAQRPVEGTSNSDYALALDNAFSVVLQDITRWAVQSF